MKLNLFIKSVLFVLVSLMSSFLIFGLFIATTTDESDNPNPQDFSTALQDNGELFFLFVFFLFFTIISIIGLFKINRILMIKNKLKAFNSSIIFDIIVWNIILFIIFITSLTVLIVN